MKKILVSLSVFCLMFSCSNNEEIINQKVWEKTSFVKVDMNSDTATIVSAKGNPTDGYMYDSVGYKFTQGSQMPEFNSESDLLEYIKANPTKTYGRLQVYLDGDLVYDVNITAGVQNPNPVPLVVGKKYPCTYAGIKTCAIESIHSQNWFQMTQCVLDGFGCVVMWYINCSIDNC